MSLVLGWVPRDRGIVRRNHSTCLSLKELPPANPLGRVIARPRFPPVSSVSIVAEHAGLGITLIDLVADHVIHPTMLTGTAEEADHRDRPCRRGPDRVSGFCPHG